MHKVTIQEEEYQFKYTNRALVEFEEVMGKSALDAMQEMETPSYKMMVALVWAGLIHQGVSYDSILDEWSLQELQEAVPVASKALAEAFGSNLKQEGQKKTQGKATTTKKQKK
jgi:hypothetical protein